jgi:methylmalonyl-CoA mutase C-terminal domain/subunit
MTLVPRIATLLKDEGAEDVVLVVGGTIPNDDIDELKKVGVAEVFTPGAPVQGIVDYIREAVPA